MSNNNNRRPFTCYFCNQVVQNETEIGHTTLCSKVLVPCPFKCGAYVQRADLSRHKSECNNNVRKSRNFDLNSPQNGSIKSSNSLDRNGGVPKSKLRFEDFVSLQRRFSELESRVASSLSSKSLDSPNYVGATSSTNLQDVKSRLNQHSLAIQKANYFNGAIAEWKKNVDGQLQTLKSSLTSLDSIKKESSKQWSYTQEKLLHMQNVQMDLNLLKETVFKENSQFKKTEMDFARNLEEIRATFNQQNVTFEKMWREHTGVIRKVIGDAEGLRLNIDEQKAKYAGLVFDLRSVSQISSEAAEKIEIIERDFHNMIQEVNQMKVNVEILEDLTSNDSVFYKRLIWRITDVESKLKRAKENDIVLKSPIFYTHRFGYKIRVLLYINGLKKWKDRYALACIHVLKGEYDPLLTWPCSIEGTITLRDLKDQNPTKNISKHMKTKRSCGDEDEDEPQESSPTYIFIPHSTMFKDNYVQDDTIFLDIDIKNEDTRYETSL